ncbi:MAG: hypothetical protein Q8Q30_02935 [Candidatus Woesebacteria bacterium]|nr:hypothetical protein [Candidatus Woesebacteria bacterium]
MGPDRKMVEKKQAEVTNDYNKANKLNREGLPDLDGLPINQLNQTTQDYIKAAQRNALSPIGLSRTSAEADEDNDYLNGI